MKDRMIMRTTTVVSLIAVALTAACGGTPPPASPAPQPSAADLTMQQHMQDSIAIVNRVQADSVNRARQAEIASRARADSAERVRVAAEATARQAASVAAARNLELRQELGTAVFFDAGKSKIRVDGGATLDRKVAILNANPEVKLQITGATDDRGSKASNQALGNRRANAVKKYLVDKGIDAGRLNEMSSGEKTPLEAGKGEEAWAKNRRVEFSIVSADRPLAMKE
jgi:peptidoglycan-associated lipoprotein